MLKIIEKYDKFNKKITFYVIQKGEILMASNSIHDLILDIEGITDKIIDRLVFSESNKGNILIMNVIFRK